MADRNSGNLTPARIAAAKPRSAAWVLWDAKVRGFGVRIFPGGAKSYTIKYRSDGRQRWYTIARVGEIGLDDARKRAGRALAEIRDGGDPARQRQARRQAPTVADGLDRFLDEYAPQRVADGLLSERTLYDYRKQAARTIRPGLGALKIADVGRADVERTLAKVAPVQRNRQLALLSRLFNLWAKWEWCEQGHNPAKLIERTREQPRDRVLAPSEIQALGAALADLADPYAAAAIKLLTLTGWRTGEALGLQWEHVNFETGEALLPSTKIGRDNRPLPAPVLALLADLPRVAGNPNVFAGARGAAIGYRKFRALFAEAARAAGLEDVRLHDLRRSVATMAAANGVSVLMLRDLLGHKSATMANRYARRAGSALQETVDASAARMAALMEGETAEIVSLKRPAKKEVAAG